MSTQASSGSPVPVVSPAAAAATAPGTATATGGSATGKAKTPPPPPLLYRERPEWQDVVPLEQYETVDPLAPIFYSDEYRDATDYFRGIVKIGEKSERVLELTETIIRINPAHYSAWQYRYDTLKAINASLEKELELMNELAIKYLKTYQVWHHRRLLLTDLRPSSPSTPSSESPSYPYSSSASIAKSELEFISQTLQNDSKNYHTWSYRQWVLSYFNDESLWQAELDYVDTMLAEDVRNNSVWHHRFFVVWQSGVELGASSANAPAGKKRSDAERDRIVKRELIYAKQQISLAPNNPSAWNYLRGVLDHTQTGYDVLLLFVTLYTKSPSSPPMAPTVPVGTLDSIAESGQETPRTQTQMQRGDIVDVENPPPSEGADLPCAAALEFLADVWEKESVKILSGGDANAKERAKVEVDKAVEIWKVLGEEYDKIRKRYWDFRTRTAVQRVLDGTTTA